MSYCTSREVRESAVHLGTESPIGLTDTILDELIARASRFFDNLCEVSAGYFETAGTVATARIFYGDGTSFLLLDPYVAGTLNSTITVPEGYTAPEFIERGGYLLLSTDGVLGHRTSPYPLTEGWFNGVAITVTAKWGYTATPDDVKLAIIELVINIWRETDPAHLKLTAIDQLPLREKAPPRVSEVARHYRNRQRIAAFI